MTPLFHSKMHENRWYKIKKRRDFMKKLELLSILIIILAVVAGLGLIGASDRHTQDLERASDACQGVLHTDGYNQCVTNNLEVNSDK